MFTVTTSLIYLNEKFYNDRIKAQEELLPEFIGADYRKQEQTYIKLLSCMDKNVKPEEIAKILDDNRLIYIILLLYKTMEYCHKNGLKEKARFWTEVYDCCQSQQKSCQL